MRRVVLPFSHSVTDESTFNYTKSIIDSEETLLFSGKFACLLHSHSAATCACTLSCNYSYILRAPVLSTQNTPIT